MVVCARLCHKAKPYSQWTCSLSSNPRLLKWPGLGLGVLSEQHTRSYAVLYPWHEISPPGRSLGLFTDRRHFRLSPNTQNREPTECLVVSETKPEPLVQLAYIDTSHRADHRIQVKPL